jgi:hypothetical protein
MAIARGAGTEIIRTWQGVDIDGSQNIILIFGEQHHIYTVLSITAYCRALQTAGNLFSINLLGYDVKAGATDIEMNIAKQAMVVGDTFVWNDKFSFMGHEPTDFTSFPLTVVKQNAIADQGSAVAQKLRCAGSEAGDQFDVTCTYIDQNNA